MIPAPVFSRRALTISVVTFLSGIARLLFVLVLAAAATGDAVFVVLFLVDVVEEVLGHRRLVLLLGQLLLLFLLDVLGDGVGEAAALDARVGDAPGEQLDGADGVVIGRDGVIDLFGVAVRVHERDDGDSQAARFGDGDVLLARVDDEQRPRRAAHLLDAA